MNSKEIGHVIKLAREARGLSQAQLGALIGVKQASIFAIETGDTQRSKFLPEIIRELAIAPESVGLPAPAHAAPALPPVASPYGPNDFEIYAAAEGGLGEILRSADPVDWWPRPIEVQQVKGAYGMYIVGTSIIPEVKPRHLPGINPNLPPVPRKPDHFYCETEARPERAP